MLIDADQLPVYPPRRPAPSLAVRWIWSLSILTLLLTVATLVLYVTPGLMVRWWRAEAEAAADGAYRKRQAELKAESEHADVRLAALDQRHQLVSLGFREVAHKVAPVIVNIRNEVEAPTAEHPEAYFDFESQRMLLQQGEGSGVIVKPGYILTNHHVVRKAQRLRVLFANGSVAVVGPDDVMSDKLTDLAVIRLPANLNGEGTGYEVATQFADSDKDVHVGDWALAVGSPFGLRQTVTAGIVSAKGRVELGILDQVELLQTDAAINPGNSGGALFDQFGRVIGINVAIASRTGANQGVGFAIPSNTAREIFAQLIEQGEVVRGFLGIFMQELPPELERKLRVKETGGIVVVRVQPKTPAAEAGMEPGDVILRYDGVPVGTSTTALAQLRQRIARTKPDTTVPIDLLRGRKKLTVEATISKREPLPY